MADAIHRITVPAEHAGQRLDQFLATALNRSRADIQRKIANGEITVSGKRTERDHRVSAGLRIDVTPDAAAPAPPAMPLPSVVAEDDAVLVLDKPAGLTMHGGPGIREQTLADWILQNQSALANVGEDPLRPGIVHRLDREASGLVVVAKTQAVYDFLKAAFQDHRVEKHYRALVHGNVTQDAGVVRFPIERSNRDGAMAARPMGGQGREAETTFTVLERLPPFSLLDVTTKTGRTHQVRVHLQAIGHPIAGDPLYHGKERAKREPPRLFLHATRLSLPHPGGGERTYESPLPPELEVFLRSLRRA